MDERRVKIVSERTEAGEELVIRVEGGGWFSSRKTELRASAWGLVATGDLGQHKRSILRIEWARLTELHYAPSGRGAVAGLYAREGLWCSRCVLPRVGEAEAETVIAAIAAKFPRYQAGVQTTQPSAVAEIVAARPFVRPGWWPSRRDGAVATSIGPA